MRGTGWQLIWLGAALLGLIGCVSAPPNPKPPPRPDEFVSPPANDQRVEDPSAAYPRETMNRTDGVGRGGAGMSTGMKGPAGRGGTGGAGMGTGLGPGGY
jgi:hypothetical protein